MTSILTFALLRVIMNYYLNRYAFREKIIQDKVSPEVGIVIVIPCHNEPNLVGALQSLADCVKPNCKVEVITVINASEKAEESVIRQNKKTFNDANEWYTTYLSEITLFSSDSAQEALAMTLHFIEENALPKKHAGVGLARKIGMDEAAMRFESINNELSVSPLFLYISWILLWQPNHFPRLSSFSHFMESCHRESTATLS